MILCYHVLTATTLSALNANLHTDGKPTAATSVANQVGTKTLQRPGEPWAPGNLAVNALPLKVARPHRVGGQQQQLWKQQYAQTAPPFPDRHI